MSTVQAEIPRKIGEALDSGKRYAVLYGGRGSGKSWNVARWLIIESCKRRLRVFCAREIMNSIAESVHQLLVDQIERLGLGWQFRVTDKEITNTETGSQFWFGGLRHSIDSIKSKEGIEICWVEEAQTVSEKSWQKLVPTIRDEGSRIIVTMNPELETDPTYQRFIVRGRERDDVALAMVNWSDNRFFTGPLEVERRALMRENYDDYLHIYEGQCKQALEGAVYAAELREAQSAGRITKVPYRAGLPVMTAWDLGWRDFTTIWFAQRVGFEYSIIDYEEARQKKVVDFLQLLQSKGYVYGTHYLPHDAEHQTVASNSVADQMRAHGMQVQVLDTGPGAVANGINAVRSLFPRFTFDEERCADGLNRLRRYRYKVDEKTGSWSPEPLHDENSHAGDGLRYLAQSLREPRESRPRARPRGGGASWMGG